MRWFRVEPKAGAEAAEGPTDRPYEGEMSFKTPQVRPARRASKSQVSRLVRLGKDYNKAVKALPIEKQQDYAREHQAVVQPKRRAQADESVLSIRVP